MRISTFGILTTGSIGWLFVCGFFIALPAVWAGEETLTREDWIDVVQGIEGHEIAAFIVGPKITLLEPRFGYEIVRDAWPGITDSKVRSGLLKAFYFSNELKPDKHPYLIKVLHLGMTDPDEKVVGTAAHYLKDYALVDFKEDHASYRAWYEEYGNQPLNSIQSTNRKVMRPELEKKLKEIAEMVRENETGKISVCASEIGAHGEPFVIPMLIGLIDSDNSYWTVYGIGYFALGSVSLLGKSIKVDYSVFHDGAWWRRWWEQNKYRFDEEIQKIPIPDFPKTAHGEKYAYYPRELDTLEGKLGLITEFLRNGDDLYLLATEIGKHNDPRAIPQLIGLITADNREDTIYQVGYFGLGRITGVKYSETHDGEWWLDWWEENKTNYPLEVQQTEIPDYRELIVIWRGKEEENRKNVALVDVADIPAIDLTIPGKPLMRYFLIGPHKGGETPEQGYKLMVVIPGGGGGEEFHPFVRRLFKDAMGEDFLVAQPVAFKWHPSQVIVWPTEMARTDDQQFSTEAFVEAVVQDVSSRYRLDNRCIFTLSWSSGGPAAYAIALQEKTAIQGSYIMMSVFKPFSLPPLDRANKRIFLIEHSPDDKVCPILLAKDARAQLTRAGAVVKFITYEGGHGWHGDFFDRTRQGIAWLV
ncbi:MAG: hypothetical protein KJ645_08610, partial [Planctomycetes bacterium]|nr:hypothetical protein [Planctomycetota bacterium]